jgi:diguanylate cyclase (GGDEF)-like protein/PAS domain S-box-containing protein
MDILRPLRAAFDPGRIRADATPGRSRPVMLAGFGSILVLLVLALAVTLAVLEIKSGLRAYVTGESLWSKGQQNAVYYLDRYAEQGNPADLRRARQALAVPLGDRQARTALEASPPDIEQSREGFLRGDNHPRDIDRLIWLYRHFSNVSHFREAVSLWREGDQYILELKELADRLEAGVESRQQLQSIRADINRLQEKLQPLEKEFSHTLGEADRWLNTVLFALVGLVLGMAALIAMLLFWWTARRLTLSERELRSTLENAGVGMALVCGAGILRSVNNRLGRILKLPPERLLGTSLEQLSAGADSPLNTRVLNAALGDGDEAVQFERLWNGSDGEPIWLRLTFSIVSTRHHRPWYYLMVAEDISEERSRVERLSWEATHDPLTGLLNRREFEQRLNHAAEGVSRDGAHHVLCFMDLDYFKDINDTYGHAVGDTLLTQLCGLMRSHSREGDVLARLGGDEFAAIFHHCPMDKAQELGETLRRAVEDFSFHCRGEPVQITASVGLVELAGTPPPGQTLLEAADRACYNAKESGRNRVYLVSLFRDSGEQEQQRNAGPGT